MIYFGFKLKSINNAPQIACRTEITQNLRSKNRMNFPIRILWSRCPSTSLPGKSPANRPNDKDGQHAPDILQPGFAAGLALLDNLGQCCLCYCLIRRVVGCRLIGERVTRERIAGMSTQERRRWVMRIHRRMSSGIEACTSSFVVEHAQQHDSIGQSEVYGNRDDNGDQASPNSSDQIGNVTHEPDEEKEERNPICIPIAVVFYQLWHLHE